MKKLIGMIHIGALPGTPRARLQLGELVETARREARLYSKAGFDALILENMHDLPYLNREVGPEIVASMTAAALAIRTETDLPLGIQVLAGGNRQALAVALASGAQFIRAEAFVFGHLADEGWMDAQAGELLRYRRQIGADHVQIWADIKKKHSSHAVTADVGLEDTAAAAEFFLADGLIVTGSATGKAADTGQVKALKKSSRLPVFVGSGVDPDNIQHFKEADGWIVGSYVKEEGRWDRPVCPERLQKLRAAAPR